LAPELAEKWHELQHHNLAGDPEAARSLVDDAVDAIKSKLTSGSPLPASLIAKLRDTDGNGRTVLHHAVVFNDGESVNAIITAGAGLDALDHAQSTPLHIAAAEGAPASVAALLAHGANASARDAYGRTPLHRAALAGEPAAARALLAAVGSQLDAVDVDGVTPLAAACAAPRHAAAVIKVLLAAGADAQSKDVYGSQPLHRAAVAGNVKAVKALLESPKVDANAADEKGRTALHDAAYAGRLDTMMALLDGGTDPLIADADGNTALHGAAAAGHATVATALLQVGGTVLGEARNAAGETAAAIADAAGSGTTARVIRERLLSAATKEWLIAFFNSNDKARLDTVDALLLEYRGREPELLQKLESSTKTEL
jgi:ankyrin repeat protein